MNHHGAKGKDHSRTPGQVENAILNTAKQDGVDCTVALWQDPGSAGKSDVASDVKMLSGYTVVTEPASKAKELYAGPLSSQAEHGNVALLAGPWNESFLSESEAFNDGAHDDQVDGASLAFLKLQEPDAYDCNFKIPTAGTRSNPWE